MSAISISKFLFSFKGRSSRHSYWSFQCGCAAVRIVYLFVALCLVWSGKGIFYFSRDPFALGEDVSNALDIGIWFLIFYFPLDLTMLLLSLGIAVRRCHDTGRKGAWVILRFIPVIGQIIFFIMMCKEGDRENNRFGECKTGEMADSIMMAAVYSVYVVVLYSLFFILSLEVALIIGEMLLLPYYIIHTMLNLFFQLQSQQY